MQIALVAVVLLAGMWFTVLKPKPATDGGAPAAAQPTAPGAAGLGRAVNQAKGASAASDVANANIQKATGGTVASTATPAATAAAKPAATKAVATKAAAKPAATKAVAKPVVAKKAVVAKKPVAATPAAAKKAATAADPSTVLLNYLAKGKTVVLLFHGDGADDVAARKAVHRVALHDKSVVSAYAPISKVAAYDAITSGIDVTAAPTILVIGKNKKAVELTGFVDYGVVRQSVGDVRAAAGQKR
jgi:hypothetical protein